LPEGRQNLLVQRQMLLLVQVIDDQQNSHSLTEKRLEAARQYLEFNYFHKQVLTKVTSHAGLCERHLIQFFM
jgi:predicted ABC-class ATPase